MSTMYDGTRILYSLKISSGTGVSPPLLKIKINETENFRGNTLRLYVLTYEGPWFRVKVRAGT
jgi:hypothetical protein